MGREIEDSVHVAVINGCGTVEEIGNELGMPKVFRASISNALQRLKRLGLVRFSGGRWADALSHKAGEGE